MTSYNAYIRSASDLVTLREEIRAGFISFALEKNRRSTPYIERAKSFRHMALAAVTPADLLEIREIRKPLLTAAGLSDKSLKYLTEEDQTQAIKELIQNFLEPAGTEFIDEAVFRYLLIKGDALGGSMRNLIGTLAQQKLIRTLLSNMAVLGIDYRWLNSGNMKHWLPQPANDLGIEDSVKAIFWRQGMAVRTLAFNLNIPLVKKNVDICLFDCNHEEYAEGKIVKFSPKIIMLGELKGGIDPAGADEHWKTANSALDRVRMAWTAAGLTIKTSFVAAAIESSMAEEIFTQLESGKLDNAANLTKSPQMIEYCNWILSL